MPRSVVVVSFRPDTDTRTARDVLERFRRGLVARDGQTPHESTHGECHLLVTGAGNEPAEESLSLVPPSRPRHLLDLPPGGWLSLGAHGVEIHTDDLGLRHVSWLTTHDWSAVSTSALVLGAVGECDLDLRAWGQLAQLGHLLTPHTLFAGVERIPHRSTATLHAGRVVLRQRAVREGSANRDGAAVLRAVVLELLSEYPDAALELSGGLDSRVILAAIPPADRSGRMALTLGYESDGDVQVARALAATEGLDQTVVALDGLGTDPDTIRAAAFAAAKARDFIGDGVFGAVLDHAEQQFPQVPRFTGVNGEYVRGFYYAGTASWNRVTPRSVRRLVDWRMTTNSKVSPDHFDSDWLGSQRAGLRSALVDTFLSTSQGLREASDDFYLRQRIANWAGATYSAAAAQRDVLAPFAHPEFVAWAGGVPNSQRKGSRRLARVLADLDARLVDVPLAGGGVPSALYDRSVASHLDRSLRTARKVAAKVRQTAAVTNRPPRATEAVVHHLTRDSSLSDLGRDLGELAWLAPRVREGDPGTWQSLDAAALSFFINLAGVQAFRREVARTATRHNDGT